MGIELQIESKPPEEPASIERETKQGGGEPTPPTPEGPTGPTFAAVAADVVALVGLFVLMAIGRITPEAGLPWIAVILAAKLKPALTGGGIATLLLPISQMVRRG